MEKALASPFQTTLPYAPPFSILNANRQHNDFPSRHLFLHPGLRLDDSQLSASPAEL